MGWWELWGISNRTDYDLKAHMKESKTDLSYLDQVNNTKYIPYVIEPSVWLTRLFLATLADAYKIEEDRTYLKLSPKVAPVTVWVLPVVKKLGEEARSVYDLLTEEFFCEYDEAGSIGKRYARFDEIGTPFCVTIDSENFDKGNVTVRNRDTKEVETVDISELTNYIKEKIRSY
jgi:glycyl-tRNA synthetase